ncbi:MAG: hypothetical protein FJ102_06615 [Deltaproteobacteria bacterium]|nr:hypothetical protein [Deltaproteobacteria bacterium]
MIALLLSCEAPTCDSGQKFNADGLCVQDTGRPPEADADTDSDSDSDSDSDTGSDSVPDSAADTADSGSDTADPGDTADSGGDTGPVELVVESFDLSATLGSGAAWYGLSIAADGTAWGATSAGLSRFHPSTGNAWLYGTADGLYTADPRAVVAHGDGTVWVGHHADDSRQGEHFQPNADGTLTALGLVDFDETSEITGVYRMREQPYGVGAGDVWMGTNEGLCLWDADLDVFQEHAHPTHPHSYSRGVAFTEEGDAWNGDEYQLSRWRYTNDGDLSTSADLYEYWVPWPVDVEVPIYIVDLDAADGIVWAASSVYGYARVDVAADAGASVTTLFDEPSSVLAIRVYNDTVLLGTADGLFVHDIASAIVTSWTGDAVLGDPIQQIAVDSAGNAWFTVPGGLVRASGAI